MFVLVASLCCVIFCINAGHPLLAKAESNNLVASLTRTGGTVEVNRVDTVQWIAINSETLVGVGDSIRTDGAGVATITFFANGTQTDLLPNSEFRIDTFNGTDTQFQLSVSVVVGQTLTRVTKLLDSGSTYTVNSTGLELGIRGTVFSVRVESSGRSATIVQQGLVKAHNNGSTTGAATNDADVPAGYGVRAEASKGLSEVVHAASFAQLDAAIDGCGATLSIFGDVTLNIRSGPNLSFPRVGRLDNNQPLKILGTTISSGWYRIPFKGGIAWALFAGNVVHIDPKCSILPKYPNDWQGEDVTRYVGLDSDVNLTVTPTPEPILTPLPTATTP
jgi:hypothetical protein